MSVSNPPAGAGDYQQQYTVNVASDSQLPSVAGWIVNVGTSPEERYPAIPLNLARSALTSLIFAIQNVELGDYVQITGPPSYLTPDVIRQLAIGTSEQLGGFFWRIAWNGAPEAPYEVVVLDDANYGRVDTDGSSLASNASSGATTLSVATSAGNPLWTTAGGDVPFDINVKGERMTVTNITGSSSPQTFTVTRSVNGVVKSHGTGEAVRLWFPPILALV